MKLKFLGKPPYLRPEHLQQDDVITITEAPYIKDGQFGTRGYAVARLELTEELFTVPFNTTSWDRLVKAYGEDSQVWTNRKAKATLETQTVRGELKRIVFWKPVVEPQKTWTETMLRQALPAGRGDLRCMQATE